MSFLLSFPPPSPLFSPFSALTYIKRLPVAFSLPGQDYSPSSDAFAPLKGFISAQCLLASPYHDGSLLAAGPLSKLHAPCLTPHESRGSQAEQRLVSNKALSPWEDKFLASSDSLKELTTRTEKEWIVSPNLLLDMEQRGLLGASSSCRLEGL